MQFGSDHKEIAMYLKLIAASLSLAFLAACNTMEGAGKDIQKGGEALQNSAEKHKDSN
jgi:entericidin B